MKLFGWGLRYICIVHKIKTKNYGFYSRVRKNPRFLGGTVH